MAQVLAPPAGLRTLAEGLWRHAWASRLLASLADSVEANLRVEVVGEAEANQAIKTSALLRVQLGSRAQACSQAPAIFSLHSSNPARSAAESGNAARTSAHNFGQLLADERLEARP